MNVLEVNDAGLLLAKDEAVLADSPGFAAMDGRTLLVGEAARARSRIDPRRTQNRFWYQLEAPLDGALGAARSQADLAFAHLQSLRAVAPDEPLLLAVPATFTREQLGVLLGLTQAAGLAAQGLVDAAVAAATTVPTHPRALHLDVQLHRFVLTVLDGGSEVALVRAQEVAKPGLTAVWDAAARLVAQAFVQQTRFDPLHSANTEQVLFDALPGWMPAITAAPTAVLELKASGRTHRASLDRDDLIARLADRYDGIASAVDAAARPRPATLLLSARAAAMPGLATRLERVAGVDLVRLDALAPARGALAHADRVVSEGPALSHVTRLPGQVRAVAAQVAEQPTHLLVGDRAVALPREDRDAPLMLAPLVAGASGAVRRIDGRLWLDGLDATGLRLNGEATALPARLSLGDRIDAAGQHLRLIQVV